MSLLAIVVLLALVLLLVLAVGALFGVVLVAGRSGRKAQARDAGGQSIA
ncbi:hypothetical protein [Nocardioides daeguensis]|uniref:Uncharacterized protein n=1 Tax=Nocardioides daeguensis TaxID=908359 RepID=A0ABP6W1T7_9ACTN|nr:hypothetical protein [Nocardioides daeguensis]MBV6726592.1 hypothetical protein [Nocardioides daeguensis]MCR1774656.1 hypothetical protein [Nocardioides daeguensis]